MAREAGLEYVEIQNLTDFYDDNRYVDFCFATRGLSALFYFIFILLLLFLSEKNISIHQLIGKYKMDKQFFKDVQKKVESDQEIKPQKLAPPCKNLHVYLHLLLPVALLSMWSFSVAACGFWFVDQILLCIGIFFPCSIHVIYLEPQDQHSDTSSNVFFVWITFWY